MTEKFWKKDNNKNWIVQEEETQYPHLFEHMVFITQVTCKTSG